MVLQRTFSSFPAGWAGTALLVLRVVVGASAIAESFLAIAVAHPLLALVIRSLVVVAGLALMLGFLTPIASTLIASVGAAMLVCTCAAVLHLLDAPMALFELVVMGAALAILGPGATSFDARLYGRREVRIGKKHRPDDNVS
jgi:hypothetical protein